MSFIWHQRRFLIVDAVGIEQKVKQVQNQDSVFCVPGMNVLFDDDYFLKLSRMLLNDADSCFIFSLSGRARADWI